MKNKVLCLFDLDGVLLDTSKLIAGSIDHAFKKHGLDIRYSPEMDGGRTMQQFYQVYAPGHDQELLLKAQVDFQAENIYLLRAFPTVRETLQHLYAQHRKVGVVTNRIRNAKDFLRHCGLLDYIHLVVTPEMIQHPKPSPEGIQLALRHFGVEPAQAIMVGDMPADIHAGRQAGVHTVGVTTSERLSELEASSPDQMIGTLSELMTLQFQKR